jgi:hypothetical protein
MNETAPKVGDRIVDRYGYLEIISISKALDTCIVQRRTDGELKRNPFTMRIGEWYKRKMEAGPLY